MRSSSCNISSAHSEIGHTQTSNFRSLSLYFGVIVLFWNFETSWLIMLSDHQEIFTIPLPTDWKQLWVCPPYPYGLQEWNSPLSRCTCGKALLMHSPALLSSQFPVQSQQTQSPLVFEMVPMVQVPMLCKYSELIDGTRQPWSGQCCNHCLDDIQLRCRYPDKPILGGGYHLWDPGLGCHHCSLSYHER